MHCWICGYAMMLGLSMLGFLTPESCISADSDPSSVLSIDKGSGLVERSADMS